MEERYKELSYKLINQWKEEEVKLNVGATEEELDKFENELKIKLPKDFRYFYSLANGMLSCSDQNMFSFWPLEEILEKKNGEYRYIVRNASEVEIAFADWLIHSHRYYLVIDNYSNSCIESEATFNPTLVDSLTCFIELYLLDPNLVHVHTFE